MKTKESIHLYNQEYSKRPEAIESARIRNARPERRKVRDAYKKTEQGKAINKLSREKNWDKGAEKRRTDLLKRYGLTPEGYGKIFESQNFSCAICGEKEKKIFHTDHCHKTGVVRGILCNNCNMALGLMKDNIKFLLKAIEYLQK